MKKTLLFTTSLLFCLCVHAQNKKELLEIEQQLVQDSATLVKKQEQLSSNVKKIESEISTLRSQIQHIDGRIDAERPIRAQHEDSIAFYHKSFLELERQKDSLQVLLEQLSKTQIFLDCETPGAEMFVDGKNVGKAPCSVSVEYGSHTFSAKKDGLEEYLEVTVYHEGQRKWKLPVIYPEIILKRNYAL